MKNYIREKNGWRKTPSDQSHVTGKSMTIPNQAYELRDLLTKYVNGQPLPGVIMNPVYDDNPTHDQIDVSSINRMDISEQHDIISEMVETKNVNAKKLKQLIEDQRNKVEDPQSQNQSK